VNLAPPSSRWPLVSSEARLLQLFALEVHPSLPVQLMVITQSQAVCPILSVRFRLPQDTASQMQVATKFRERLLSLASHVLQDMPALPQRRRA
jgi:hypothetical protein